MFAACYKYGYSYPNGVKSGINNVCEYIESAFLFQKQ